MKTYIVLWDRDGKQKFGSVENTPENMTGIKEKFHTTLIQEDTNGTIHLAVWYPYKNKKSTRQSS